MPFFMPGNKYTLHDSHALLFSIVQKLIDLNIIQKLVHW